MGRYRKLLVCSKSIGTLLMSLFHPMLTKRIKTENSKFGIAHVIMEALDNLADSSSSNLDGPLAGFDLDGIRTNHTNRLYF